VPRHPLRILETCLYAEDLDRAESFYRNILGLMLHSRSEGRSVFFRCGGAMLLIFDPRRTRIADAGVPAHGSDGPGHVAFAVPDEELDQWRARLEASGVEIEREMHWPRGGRSLYFRDPAGNSIELGTPTLWSSPPPSNG
jgi:catechol 2,3-dioxygenase-like lactoylglutathione lyase family enzyme